MKWSIVLEMKKIILLSLLAFLPLLADAYDVQIDGIYYNLNQETKQAEVTYKSYDSYSGIIVIPSSVRYNGYVYSVTSIGEKAFYRCIRLTSVTVPNSVISIGSHSFAECSTALKSVTIGNSVNSIGRWAFYDCKGITSITIPNSVTSINNSAFYGCI